MVLNYKASKPHKDNLAQAPSKFDLAELLYPVYD